MCSSGDAPAAALSRRALLARAARHGVATAAPDDPAAALAELLAGNQRFVEGRIMAPHRNTAG